MDDRCIRSNTSLKTRIKAVNSLYEKRLRSIGLSETRETLQKNLIGCALSA